MEKQLIWTIKGNLPLDELSYSHKWEETNESVVFVEEYRLGDEIVKRNAHVYIKRGTPTSAEGSL